MVSDAEQTPQQSGYITGVVQPAHRLLAGYLCGRGSTSGPGLWEKLALGINLQLDGTTVNVVSPIDQLLNGAAIESVTLGWTESGGVVSATVEKSGTGDVQFYFGGVAYTLDCTPIATVALTVGTDVAPQINYVYVTEAVGVLTLTKNTTGFPATSHAPIATLVVQSAASVATDGPYKVHAWIDHLSKATENGHLAHLNAKFRALNATWISGVAPSDLATNQFATALGVVYQLHPHTMPARDMSSGDPLYVVNDSVTPYKRITSIGAGGISSLSDGTAIGNNKYVNFVLWGVVNEDETDCKLMLNLPDGQYTASGTAQTDDDNTVSYSFGNDFVGTAFLIARFTLQYSTGGGGSFTQVLKTDLRGLAPSTSPGGGSITDHGNLAGLSDNDHPQYALLTNNLSDIPSEPAARANISAAVENTVDQGRRFSHFDKTSHADSGFSQSASGAGAGVTQGWDFITTGSGMMGCNKLDTGTTATGYCAFHTWYNVLRVNNGHAFTYSVSMLLEALSTAAQEYKVEIGFGNLWNSAASQPDCAVFRYDRATYGNDNWHAVTSHNSVETVTDTGVEPSVGFTGTPQELEIVIDNVGSAITFYIDGTLEANHKTSSGHNLPDNTDKMGYGQKIVKTVGTTERDLGLDWYEFTWSLT